MSFLYPADFVNTNDDSNSNSNDNSNDNSNNIIMTFVNSIIVQ